MTTEWNKVTVAKSGGRWYPSEPMIRLAARFIQRRNGIDSYKTKRPIKRVLDVGCGIGNHVLFFSEQGLSVTGIDISGSAIEIGRHRAVKAGVDANFVVGDAVNMSWGSNTFDLVISDGVLGLVKFSKAKQILAEVRRVLEPNGYLFVSLRSTADSEYKRGERVEKNTYILQDGYQQGMLQHFFDRKHIEKLFDGFEIFDIEHLRREYPADFGINKSYLQSSRGLKRPIELRNAEFSLEHARWWIAAKRSR